MIFLLFGKSFVSAWSGLIATSGDILSTSKWNELVNKVLPLYSTGGINGNVWVGITSPTAKLHLKAGTATANTAPMKFTSWVNMTTPEAWSFEFDGTQLFFSPSATRNILAQVSWGTALTTGSIPFATTNGYLTQDNTNFFWDNTGKRLAIGIGSANTKLDVNGDIALRQGTDYSTTGIQNDVVLSSGTVSNVRYTGAATATFNGITGGQNGKILLIHNASNFTLTLAHEAVTSTAGNRIYTPNGQNLALKTNTSIFLTYDSVASRWRIVDSTPQNYIYRLAGPQTRNVNTYAAVPWLTSGTLPLWAYKFKFIGKFRSTLATSGAWFSLVQNTAVLGNYVAQVNIQLTNTSPSTGTVFPFSVVVPTAPAHFTTWVTAANTDYYAEIEWTFEVTTTGTVEVQMRPETNGQTLTLQAGSYLEIEPLY